VRVLNIIQEDHPGLLAEVTTLLEQEGIPLQDFTGYSVGNTAVISLTVIRDLDAFRLLSDAGYRVYASQHLLVRLKIQPGALAELSRRLVAQDINVRGMHIVNRDDHTAIVALETLDHKKARLALHDILV
jgi:hypothetical protein